MCLNNRVAPREEGPSEPGPDPLIKVIIFIVFVNDNDAWHLWEVGDVSLKCFKCGA